MSMKLSLLAQLGLSALIGGADCGIPSKCTATCAAAGTDVDQTALTSPIATLSTEPPCLVTKFSEDGGSKVDGGTYVQVTLGYGGLEPSTGSCQIHVTVADGSTWMAVFSWALQSGGCCPQYNLGPTPVFSRTDAGAP